MPDSAQTQASSQSHAHVPAAMMNPAASREKTTLRKLLSRGGGLVQGAREVLGSAAFSLKHDKEKNAPVSETAKRSLGRRIVGLLQLEPKADRQEESRRTEKKALLEEYILDTYDSKGQYRQIDPNVIRGDK